MLLLKAQRAASGSGAQSSAAETAEKKNKYTNLGLAAGGAMLSGWAAQRRCEQEYEDGQVAASIKIAVLYVVVVLLKTELRLSLRCGL
jgi:hypothetical protein